MASTTAPASRREAALDLLFELRAIPFFRGLSADELVPVATIATLVTYPAGHVVFRQRDEGDRLYVISRGAVDVLRDDQRIATLGRGECFGEMALLDEATRSATIVARSDIAMLTLARDDFLDLLDVYPAIARTVAKLLTERLREAYESG